MSDIEYFDLRRKNRQKGFFSEKLGLGNRIRFIPCFRKLKTAVS